MGTMVEVGTGKLGSPIHSQFGDGECDFCTTSLMNEINAKLREAYPFWFANEGSGNLLTKYMDLYTKKCRSELAERLKTVRVWKVACGFCDEPFGVCAAHLQEVLDELK